MRNSSARRSRIAVLASVTLLSIAFRLGPLDFVPEPDEYRVEGHLENFYRTRSLEPVNWINPPTTQYLCWAVETAPVASCLSGAIFVSQAVAFGSVALVAAGSSPQFRSGLALTDALAPLK